MDTNSFGLGFTLGMVFVSVVIFVIIKLRQFKEG